MTTEMIQQGLLKRTNPIMNVDTLINQAIQQKLQPQQKVPFSQSKEFSQALLNLGSTLLLANQQNIPAGAALAIGAGQFSQAAQAQQDATDLKLADLKDIIGLRLQQEQLNIARSQQDRAQVQQENMNSLIETLPEDQQLQARALGGDFVQSLFETKDNTTDDMRELDALFQMFGNDLTPEERASIAIQKLGGGPSTVINNLMGDGEDPASLKVFEDVVGQRVSGILEQDIGQQRLAIDRVDEALNSGTKTGALSGVKLFAGRLGIPVDDLEGLETIEEVSNQLAVPMTKQLGVNPTDRDFQIILSTVANVGKSPEANKNFTFVTKQLLERNERIQSEVESLSADGAPLRDINDRIREIKASTEIKLPEINDGPKTKVPSTEGIIDFSELPE